MLVPGAPYPLSIPSWSRTAQRQEETCMAPRGWAL